MGGHGSGRWGAHTKAMTVESCYALSIKAMRAWGLFDGGRRLGSTLTRSCGGRVIEQAALNLRVQGLEGGRAHLVVELGRGRQEVALEERAFRFGGRSWWMLCPGCGRQCLKLYLSSGAWSCPSPFRCRSCWRLTYTAAQEAHYWDRGWFASSLAGVAARLGIPFREAVEAIQPVSKAR